MACKQAAHHKSRRRQTKRGRIVKTAPGPHARPSQRPAPAGASRTCPARPAITSKKIATPEQGPAKTAVFSCLFVACMRCLARRRGCKVRLRQAVGFFRRCWGAARPGCLAAVGLGCVRCGFGAAALARAAAGGGSRVGWALRGHDRRWVGPLPSVAGRAAAGPPLAWGRCLARAYGWLLWGGLRLLGAHHQLAIGCVPHAGKVLVEFFVWLLKDDGQSCDAGLVNALVFAEVDARFAGVYSRQREAACAAVLALIRLAVARLRRVNFSLQDEGVAGVWPGAVGKCDGQDAFFLLRNRCFAL